MQLFSLVYSGLWQFPFHIALEPPKGGLVNSLYESYHGAYVNIQVPCLSIFLFPNGLLEDVFLSIFMDIPLFPSCVLPTLPPLTSSLLVESLCLSSSVAEGKLLVYIKSLASAVFLLQAVDCTKCKIVLIVSFHISRHAHSMLSSENIARINYEYIRSVCHAS